ncbi:hypothetical protein AK812_SmicGene45102 [Symbiodinium microadriaticum]|uniref:Uncharacterized protein n=1 Tax=Symbiodinium microadriaticum TaxID=2951 RepID=A0A1Q9BWS0_SYMMI|nr:hypothetical protein AK812_SmicGene45102 [Symbiodinium microadriaticum]
MSSWSSAFDPITSPLQSPESRPKTKKKKKKSAKKKRDTRHKTRKKEKKRPRGATSSAAGTADKTQHAASRGHASSGAPEMRGDGMEHEPPAPPSPSLGRWVFQAFWEPARGTQLPEPPPKRRAVAKMLVRAGLRCQCHFALVADCPFSRQASVRGAFVRRRMKFRYRAAA